MEPLTLYRAVYSIDEGVDRDQLFSHFVWWGIQTSSKHDQYLKSLAGIKDTNPELYKKILNWD